MYEAHWIYVFSCDWWTLNIIGTQAYITGTQVFFHIVCFFVFFTSYLVQMQRMNAHRQTDTASARQYHNLPKHCTYQKICAVFPPQPWGRSEWVPLPAPHQQMAVFLLEDNKATNAELSFTPMLLGTINSSVNIKRYYIYTLYNLNIVVLQEMKKSVPLKWLTMPVS